MLSILTATAVASTAAAQTAVIQAAAQQSLSQQNSTAKGRKQAPIARQMSIASANGYPIARQVLISDREVLQPQDIRPLPGGLNSIPVFNSNSPEAVRSPGILLSTFPGEGKQNPSAHLGYTFQGRFDLFAHHIAKTDKPDTTPTLYNGILIYNPSPSRSITLNVLKAASFLGTPDAPYIDLPSLLENPFGRVFSGPGGRLTDALLRNNRQAHWPSRITLGPKQSSMLMNLPIPVPRPAFARLPWNPNSRIMIPSLIQQNPALNRIQLNSASSSNTRSTLMELHSTGPLYMAYLAMHAPVSPTGQEGIPQKSDWENLVIKGDLVNPRDRPPSPLGTRTDRFYYGRVSGVSQGSQWHAQVTDTPKSKKLTIPAGGEAFSYGLSTLPRGTFGTGQIQSAPMIKRYPDTAYLSHGNYGVHYHLTLPLYNPRKVEEHVAISIQTPLKQDVWDKGLRFFRALPEQAFFRGTVRLRYSSDGVPQQRYFHITQRQGQQGEPLAILKMNPKESQLVSLDYYYPPDATPPQVLTVQTLANPPLTQQSAYGIQR
ncbi:MAG: DUF3370 domain-containing protein [Thermosynechococcaceae cyanobacterium MS004]|nr:DUF3370 domain-containing protein [Thermosynechococcaceae cyanobacterium MS004]